MNDFDFDVAVVGAGPTGLTLSNLLGQAGIRVALIERNEGTVREPRAVSIDDESLRTMQAVGVIDAIIKNVALDYGSHYYTASGQCFAKVEPTTREYGFPRRNAFTQPKLEATLREALDRFANIKTFFLHGCESVEEDENGVSLALKSDGGADLKMRVRYLVASDGARSAIRKHIGATLGGSTYRQRWLIVDLGSTKERLRQTRVVCDPERPLITLPGPDGIRRYEFMLHDGEDEQNADRLEFVRELLAKHGPDGDAPIVRRQVYSFHARVVDRWNTKRIFLAGDAAHLSPPFAGQGMNSGIRDAHNLAWKLTEVVKERLGPELLATYRQERAPHAWALIQLAINIGRIMMPTSRLNALAVQLGFRATKLAPAIQAYFAQMKYKPKPFYREGFVVADDGGLKIVGRMAPQPTVELLDRAPKMLDDLIGNRFSLVAYGVGAQQVIAAAAALDFGLGDLHKLAILPSGFNPRRDAGGDIDVVRDINGAFGSMAPPDRDVLMLIRPDRYVAAATIAEPSRMAQLAAAVKQRIARTWMVEEDAKAAKAPTPAPVDDLV